MKNAPAQQHPADMRDLPRAAMVSRRPVSPTSTSETQADPPGFIPLSAPHHPPKPFTTRTGASTPGTGLRGKRRREGERQADQHESGTTSRRPSPPTARQRTNAEPPPVWPSAFDPYPWISRMRPMTADTRAMLR